MAYIELEERGRGGFGIVHIVQNDNQERFAKKTLIQTPPPGITTEQLTARFNREVKYQSAIDHPNVVKIVDYDLNATPPYFIMELADCSLEEELKDDATLGGDPKQALFDILAGLEAIHQKGFKHRDLKPANVLKFISDDADIRYAISDFGLMTPEEGQTTTLTASNMAGGTPRYRAPECAIHFKRATPQSDIYSFGAILHDIYGSGTRIPHAEIAMGGPLGPIVEKCTKTNVRRRYKEIKLLREDLYEALTNEDIQFSSEEEEAVAGLLQDKDELTDDEWDRVFEQIDNNDANGRSNHPIFRAISLAHITHLHDSAPELFASFGNDFAEYAKSRSFDFEYCDVLGSKARQIYRLGQTELRAKIAVSMLILGTNHNRWFVEKIFIQMASNEISDVLAERIKVEIEVQGVNFEQHIERLENSISISKEVLHPVLRDMLSDGSS